MSEKIKSLTLLERLKILIDAGENTLEEMEVYQTLRDLGGDMPTTKTYLKESKKTKAWFCPDCKEGPIPCAIDCQQCGHARPEGNFDPDQEGVMGKYRDSARARK